MSDDLKVTAVEFQRNIGHYSDIALTRPVTVTRHGRDRTVLLSADEYQRLRRRDREVLTLDDFTDSDLKAIRAAKPARGSVKFDSEVK